MKLITPSISYLFSGTVGASYPVLAFNTSPTSTDVVSVDGCDQVGILFSVSGPTSAIIQVAWTAEYSSSSTQAYYECVEVVGALHSGFQRFSLQPKEFGPLAAGASGCIWLPIAAAGLQVLVYSDTATTSSDQVAITLMLTQENPQGL